MVALTNIQTKFSVPASFTEEQRKTVASLIIQKIQDNTTIGKDRYGGSFPSYTSAYKKSSDFKIAGKSSLPNLQLSGDMLASLELVSTSTGSVTIGYKGGSIEAGKVEGNVIGSYGGVANPGHARPFIGLPQAQLDLIIAEVESQNAQLKAGVDNIIENLLNRF